MCTLWAWSCCFTRKAFLCLAKQYFTSRIFYRLFWWLQCEGNWRTQSATKFCLWISGLLPTAISRAFQRCCQKFCDWLIALFLPVFIGQTNYYFSPGLKTIDVNNSEVTLFELVGKKRSEKLTETNKERRSSLFLSFIYVFLGTQLGHGVLFLIMSSHFFFFF